MKYFTEPNGKFAIKIPVEWQYKNGIHNMGHVSPFGFQLYEKPVGAFQISCYPTGDRKFDPSIRIQKGNTANLIDAYLRQSLLMKKQIDLKTNEIDIVFLYQGDEDKTITERQIYNLSKDQGLTSQALFDKLETLYKKRNKIVHRYIISDLKTNELLDIFDEYEIVCEEVRLVLKKMEDLQFREKIGIHGGQRDPREEHSPEAINFLMSLVNDKHLLTGLKRDIQ